MSVPGYIQCLDGWEDSDYLQDVNVKLLGLGRPITRYRSPVATINPSTLKKKTVLASVCISILMWGSHTGNAMWKSFMLFHLASES